MTYIMSLKRTINNERFQRYFKNISTIVLSKEKSLSMKKERCGTREKKKSIVRRFYVIDLLFFILRSFTTSRVYLYPRKKMISCITNHAVI